MNFKLQSALCILSLLCVHFLTSSFNISRPKRDIDPIKSKLVKSLKNGNIKIYKLNSGYNDLGHAIWLNRSSKKINAKYFSSGEVYQNYNLWSNNKDLILACSGAFSDNLNKGNGALPVGLNIENGYIKNRSIKKDGMDGLVIVYATGGIVVSDLTKGNL